MSALSPGGVRVASPFRGDHRLFDLHAVSIAARAFTGDFYYTAERAGGSILVVGDVAGKGLASAVLMGMLQEELERLICVERISQPGDIVAGLDRALRSEMPVNRFATVVAVRLEPTGRVTLVNAGHCPPLVLRSGGEVEEIPSGGPPIGIVADPRWAVATAKWGEGDTLLLYSDGLLEARSPDEEEFGLERLRRLLSALAEELPRRLARSIVAEVRAHARGEPQDDLTMLIARRPSRPSIGSMLRRKSNGQALRAARQGNLTGRRAAANIRPLPTDPQ